MRRMARTAALCILIGAVVNFAVAWGSAYWNNPNAGRFISVVRACDDKAWYLSTRTTLTSQRFASVWNTSTAPTRGIDPAKLYPRWARPHSSDGLTETRSLDGLLGLASGFPLLSFCSHQPFGDGRFQGVTFSEPTGIVVKSGITTVQFSTARILPTTIIWRGFLINSAGYAGAIYLLLLGGSAPFSMRRWVRRRQRCCESCGYRIGASVVCTECGSDLKLQRE